jgi:hypothetical protein
MVPRVESMPVVEQAATLCITGNQPSLAERSPARSSEVGLLVGSISSLMYATVTGFPAVTGSPPGTEEAPGNSPRPGLLHVRAIVPSKGCA